jgi:hypothetical protein
MRRLGRGHQRHEVGGSWFASYTDPESLRKLTLMTQKHPDPAENPEAKAKIAGEQEETRNKAAEA